MSIEGLEDIYELSPMQEGMLFHTLYSPGSGMYCEQLACTLEGDLDVPTFRRAWEQVVERHAVLRTAFHWQDLKKPVQVVHREVEVPWEEGDWRGLCATEQEARLAAYLEEERRNGFPLEQAPLVRLALFRTGAVGHRFVFSFHHLLMDGWCVPLVLREVLAFYEAGRSGAAARLPRPRPYRDFIVWLQRRSREGEEAFWRRTLAGFQAPTPLPGDEGPAAVPAAAEEIWDERREEIPAAEMAAVHALTRAHQLTLNTVVQAAWGLLLSRTSGETDVVFGATVSGRPASLAGVESMIGLFINTLPVRIAAAPGTPLLPWLKDVQDRQAEAREHEHTPLPLVQAWSDVPPGQPLFDSILVFENQPVEASPSSTGPSLRIGDVRVVERTSYPLDLDVIPGPSALLLRAVFDPRRLSPTAVARMLGHLRTLLAAMTRAEAGTRLEDLPFLTAPEQQQVIHEWNDTEILPPAPASFPGLFAAQAGRTLEATAAVCSGEELTYGELLERSRLWAERLAARGVGPESLVAILAPRGLPFLSAVLAVLTAGGAWLPLDPNQPPARTLGVLRRSGARWLLTGGGLGTEEAPALEVLEIEDLAAPSRAAAPLRRTGGPEHLAYVIYTSGSTGLPKGAMVHHGGLLNHLLAKVADLGLTGADTVAQNAPQSFDISVWQMLAPLAVGARVVIYPDEVAHDPRALLAAAERDGVTVLEVVPSLLAAMLDGSDAAEPDLARLRWLIPTGEALPPELCRRWLARYPEVPLLNAYGPTECSDDVSHGRVREAPPAAAPRIPIGRPVANLRLYVMDRQLGPQPAGVPGELYVGGAGVGRGYLAEPERTAQAFLPDPFAGTPGGRLYRTGDLARRRADGELEFLGRVDHQVKMRGFRIELGEIEAALNEHPSVREAAVLLREGPAEEKRLVAYVATREGRDARKEDLRSALAGHLPPYMIPSAFVVLAALPLGPAGKIDRHALARIEPAAGAPGEGSEAPATPLEDLLAGVWKSLLGVGRVGRRDDFFALGGHSLLATQLVSRLREAFGVELPLRAVFDEPTLERLARRLDEARREGRGMVLPPLRPAPREGDLPLSFAQERLWFLDRLDPGSPVYNMPTALHLTGDLGWASLAGALRALVDRHEALRTIFPEHAGAPRQVIAAEPEPALPVVDLRALPPAAKEAEAALLIGQDAVRPFDLARGPLLRASLLRREDREWTALLNLHHIVGDGWSLGVLVAELSALYASRLRGEPSPLPALPVQYADYAVWQRTWLQGEILEAELAWWRAELAGAPTLLELPTDRPRPAGRTYRGAIETASVEPAVSGELADLARRASATPFMVLLAAFTALLHRYSGEDDFLVGSPIANRNHAEVEGLIGFFVNTLALRSRVAPALPFDELLARVRTSALDAYAHQDLPFERLVDALGVPRSLAHSPLFQVALILQNAPPGTLELPGLTLRPYEAPSSTAKLDLSLSVAEMGGDRGLTLYLEHATDLFDRSTAARLLGHLGLLLAGVAAGPDLPLSDLPLLSPAEREQLRSWSSTGPAAAPAPITEIFAAQAARSPEAPAILCGDERITYGELALRVERLARHLRSMGLEPEMVTGLCIERSPRLVEAALAVLAAGGAYLPLDPDYPPERLRLLLEDSGAVFLLTTSVAAERLPALGPGAVTLFLDDDLPDTGRGALPVPDPGQLAYVIYTSGSTGRPKGVLVEHRGIPNLAAAQARIFDVGPGDRVLQLASPSFDASVWEIWMALTHGATLVIASRDERMPGPDLLALLRDRAVTHATLPPTALAALPAGAAAQLPDLRCLIVAGEACPAPLARAWSRGRRFFNAYGPTESTVCASVHEVTGEEGERIPIGRPLPGLRLHVLDAALSPRPAGVPGELFLGGIALARGYLGRPDRTAERFLPDPSGVEAGSRLYSTGDNVRWRPDGTLEFLGRGDEQVKVRGFRIEPGEIEAALALHPRVREAVVLAQGAADERRLAAFVAVGAGAAPQPGELRAWLGERLPDYMVPSSWTVLESLPLLPNGKVDRAALVRGEPGQERRQEAVAPRTPMERELALLWGEVLGVEALGVHESFFELGGHSLLATRLISRVHDRFGVELPLRAVFEAPTVAALAERVEAERGSAHPAAPPLRRQNREGAPPLSYAQARFWFLDRLEPGSPAYNIPTAVRLEGRLDVPALAASLDEIVRRHEALRTSFPAGPDGPVQAIAPELRIAIPTVDLRALPGPEREAAARTLVLQESRRPFDLATGPLLRILLLQLAAEVHEAVLTLHHIVADGWSAGVLVGELSALYAACIEGRPSPLQELPIQYADFAAWQRQWLEAGALEDQLRWWREALAGAPPVLELPTDRPRPAVQRFRGASQGELLPARLERAIRALAQEAGATPFMVVLAALNLLLSRHSGQQDVVVGSPIAGRTRSETEPLIGLFLNTLALRIDLSGDPTFRTLLERVRAMTLAAYAHQDLPFERLVDELAPERNLSHAPLFQVLLVLQNLPFEPVELPGLTLRPAGADTATSKLDLVLNATETGGGLFCHWMYNRDLFDATRVARLRGHFASLLEAALADPERRLSELPLLAEAEQQQVLREWKGRREDLPGAAFPALFAAQAARTPEAVAAICRGEELTYRQLLDRSRRWAGVLARHGVGREGPESVVAILAERGLPFLTAVLAVFEAGGAYLPLDPHQPPSRALAVLRQSGARWLLSGDGLGLRLLAGADDLDLLELEDLARLEGGGRPAGTGPDRLAYVIFTSGSTGLPKGAMVHHRGLLNHLLAKIGDLGLSTADTVAQNASQSFDISVWQMLAPLAVGGRVAIYPDEVAHDPAGLLAAVERDGVTVLEVVPSMMAALLEGDGLSAGRLRWLVPTGEALPPELARRWLVRYPEVPLLNAYGPTECSDDVSHGPVREAPSAASVPIGRPVVNTGLYVVDGDLRPQPLGVPGELCVGGEGVGRGYLGEPGRTAPAFVPDPFGGAPGARLYRTGDLARWLPSGEIEFLGRIDHQVKVRGFRIELGEIEAALASHPAVRQAVVDPRGEGAGRRLVAYVVTGTEDLAAALRDHLQSRLPDYMVPSAFVHLAELPLTPNGKVDRKALPAPDAPLAADGPVAPRTPLEVHLAGLWREALRVESVGIHDSFFDLGGSSITGAVMINRLQREIGEILHVVVIFDAPTVAKMAAYLAREHREAVVRLWGAESLGEQAADAPVRAAGRVDAAKVAEIRALIPSLPPASRPEAEKNPPAVFVLSPPRSGSTLLRVMLGGHPGLFAPPELELLSFDTLAERKAAFPGRDSFWLEGVIRAVMEAHGCDVETARQLVEACEAEGWTTQRFYRLLQEWLDGRMLVDKTPSYALDPGILERAEAGFDSPVYIHLLRHPWAVVRSFEEAKLDQLFFRPPHAFGRTELAELIWVVSHQNIARHLARVPPERQIRVRFEDLVRDPETELRRICAALGIDYHPDMADPYRDQRARMTDGIHAEGRMLGDVKFHQHRGIEAGAAERWRELDRGDTLGEPTWEMAAALGYERPARDRATAPVPRRRETEEPLPLSFAQERLWFLHQLDPGSPVYNMPFAFTLRGALDVAALEEALREIARRHESLRTSFPEADGAPRQVVAPEPGLLLPVVDLGGLPAAERETEAARLSREDALRPFDLSRGPLLRAALLRRDEREWTVLLNLHHIVSDGWSLGVLVRELSALYPAFLRGEPSPLPELPIQYADFALWQRRWLRGEALEAQLAWWRQELAGAPTLLEMPADRPRPAVQSGRGAWVPVRLPGEVAAALAELARSYGSSLFMALLAGFQALLARLSGQDDLVVGSPVANRNRAEVEGLIGFFVNTLALRARLDRTTTFRGLLAQVRAAALGSYAHQDLPFERLVEELHVPRSLGHNPLVQVLLVVQDAPGAALDLPGLTLVPAEGAEPAAKFDLTLSLAESGGEILGSLDYATDLFDAATALRLAERFSRLLAEAVAAPDLPLGRLPLLTGEERGQLLAWNGTGVAFPEAACLHELVRAQAERAPDAPAVAFEGRSLTYRQLVRRAGHLASRLRALGVGPEAFVGLCAERSLELVVGLLGILEAGGAWVPLDPGSPDERLACMTEDARLEVLLAAPHLAPRLLQLAGSARVVPLEADEEGDAPDAGSRMDPEHAAYCIFTSGSTGRPKGAVNSHRGIVNRLLWGQRAYPLTAADRVLQKTPFSFDVSVWEFFAPLTAGACLVVARPEGHRDPAYLVETIAARAVTVVHFVPSMLPSFLEAEGLERCAGLRRVVCSGEALPAELARRLFARLGSVELINLYGPTEAGVEVTYHACAPEESQIPIGRPVANTQAWVLEPEGEPAPVGTAGELCLGGVQAARGYAGRPDLTAERFVPDSFGPPGARLYRTGDLARWSAHGEVEYLGRIDHQVKVRGFRIELGEIEAALLAVPGVEAAAVLAQGDGAERRLVAYLVCGTGAPVEAVRRALRERLPDYMVPAAFAVLPALPRLPSGKVDRRALALVEPALEPGAAAQAPRTSTEIELARIWSQVLGRERVGLGESFFDLGGHSLLATRMVSRVREAFGVELPLRAVFEAPTVEGLARRIEEALREGSGAAAPPLRPVPHQGDLPLSFAQERLWFLDQLEPGSPAYNISAALRLRGGLDVAALARSFAEIVRRHEALRTTFPEIAGAPRQVVAPAAGPLLPVIDLEGLPAAALAAEVSRLARQAALRPFDLAHGPLLRTSLLRRGEEEWTALLGVHHIVSDGWSLGVLVRELSALYAAFRRGEPSPLPELPVQYADYAVWQREWLQGEALAAQLAWWREELAGAPTLLELPADRPRPPVQTYSGGTAGVLLDRPLAGALADLARREGTTLFMVLLAGLQALLSRYSGEEDLLVGTPIAGRTRAEVEGLVGLFLNTLVLRGRLGGAPSFRGLLARVRASALGSYAHQELPFERLVDELGVERSLAHSPLFQVMLALQNAPVEPLELPGLSLAPEEVPSATAKFDLSLTLSEAGGRIAGVLEHAADLFDAATARRMVDHYRTLLEAAAADPDGRVPDLPLLTEGERRQIAAWNETEAAVPPVSLFELVRAQAERAPGAPALAQGDQSLNYGELTRRAGALAAHLRGLGIGPEARVGLAVERTPGMLVGLLGISAAGGAYVPLDPAHPRERLGLVLEDAAPAVLVTQPEIAATLPGHGARIVLLDDDGLGDWDPLAEPPADPGDLAYVLYTSGSTGRPKGVQIPHGALVNFLLSMQREPGLAAGDTLLAVTTLSFDIAGLELLLPLLAGARIALAGREEAADAERLMALLAASGATVMQATPATWRLLLDAGWPGDPDLAALCGGEALPGELAARLLPRVRSLWNLYGPTETTIWSAAVRVESADPAAPGLPIGPPIANTQLRVVDRGLQPVPAGVPGELCIGGAGLARGYLGRPELTAERFVPDPFAERPGARLYRAGDLVRRRATGEIDFLGRMDHQVKVRGFRIELGEIEAALAAHPAVRQAVAGVRGPADARRLVAWIVAEGEAAASLRSHLRTFLPDYMVPTDIVLLDVFPLTPNGKVDRRALPEPEASPAVGGAAPRDGVEEMLAVLWEEVLGRTGLGSHESFFDLGGHSLLATRVMSRVRSAFGVELPLRTLFEAPTISALAARIGEALRAGARLQAPPLVPMPRDTDLPLSFAQQRLWFLQQLDPAGTAYNMPFALRLRGPLEIPALARSLEEIVRRHETLRTAFPVREGRPVQSIAPPEPLPLPVIDLSGLPEPLREAAAERLAGEEGATPFDLSRPPAVRPRLLRLEPAGHVLLFTVHHISVDEWSTGVFTRELVELYGALTESRLPRLPALPVQYADFAKWQRDWLRGEVLEEQISWWRGQLAGSPAWLDLPTDRPRPPVQTFHGRRQALVLPEETGRALRDLGRRAGVTPFMLLLAAFQALLHRCSGDESVVVGTPIANRHHAEVEDLIGFFVNTLALRADFVDGPGFTGLLHQVRETALGAYAHQDLPFERLVDELQPQRDMSRAPLFQVLFVYQGAPDRPLRLPGLEILPFGASSAVARFDLTLACSEGAGGGVACVLDYNTDLFEDATATRLLRLFAHLLASALADPDVAVSALPLLDEAERRQVVLEANGPRCERPAAGLHQLFERQAERTPDAPAVVAEAGSLTYRDLDRRAGEIAALLVKRGIGPEAVVALCLERTPETVAAMLGVLKAGGAYLPLDPDAPRDRLAVLIADAGAALVLTHERLVPVLSGLPAPVVPLETAPGTGAPAAPLPAPGSAAYVIYTSGSTGAAKGVVTPHRAAVNFALALGEAVELGPGDRILLFAPLSFDASVLQIFPALARGAGVVIHRNPRELAGGDILGFCERFGVTVLDLPAALWRQWVDEAAARQVALPASLRAFLTGGESVPVARLRSWAGLAGRPISFLSSYGPTEATVTATVYQTASDQIGAPEWGQVPIGVPLANTGAWVLDPGLRPVPPGLRGELFLAGDGLARGYLGRPDLTAAAFVPDPVSGEPGARLYRTGDLARRLADGHLEFLGRADRQVKIRGFRVEPGEVEAALARHPAVRETAVLAREEAPGSRRLVAYFTAETGEGTAPPASAELRTFLAAALPDFMVPSAFVLLDGMPLLASGKVDRRALPAPDQALLRRGTEHQPPRTAVERVLAGIWQQVLGVPEVGAFDDFFELGGHSLLATQVASRIREELEVDLELRQVFEAPTVARLAEALLADPARRDHVTRAAELTLELAELPDDQIEAMLTQEAVGSPEGKLP